MASMELDDDVGLKRKGRGFQERSGGRDDVLDTQTFDKLDHSSHDASSKAARSIEGWIVIVTNVHEEATEDDLQDKFSEFGKVENMHLNLDRRTGYVKGYALVEYATRREAERAVKEASGTPMLEQIVTVDFAFVQEPKGTHSAPAARRRSVSPSGKKGSLESRIN